MGYSWHWMIEVVEWRRGHLIGMMICSGLSDRGRAAPDEVLLVGSHVLQKTCNQAHSLGFCPVSSLWLYDGQCCTTELLAHLCQAQRHYAVCY